jgi:hypothetical protein
MNPSRQRITVLFSTEQRETIRKALEKLQTEHHHWNYFSGESGESAFIRDAVTFAARQILEGKGRGETIRKRVSVVGQLAYDLETECGRLRKLLTLKPDRVNLTLAKR